MSEERMFMDKTLVFDVLWDNEAEVWYTYKTPVQGAMAEAPTLDELYSKLSVIVSEMLQMNNEDLICQMLYAVYQQNRPSMVLGDSK